MNVDFSNNITDITKLLREKVYDTDKFKNSFVDELKTSICATDASFVPDQFGGWSVNISVDRDKCKEAGICQNSTSYLNKISSSLASAIHNTNKSFSYSSMTNNLANVIITGNDSIVVKL